MTKQEFTESIRRSIAPVGDYNFINDTVEYYQNYIETAMAKGISEEEVLSELGDPKLIAKSILASQNVAYTETVEEDVVNDRTFKEDNINLRTGKGKLIKLPFWLIKAGVITLGIGIVALAGFLLIQLLPVIVVGLLAYLLYKFFKDNF